MGRPGHLGIADPKTLNSVGARPALGGVHLVGRVEGALGCLEVTPFYLHYCPDMGVWWNRDGILPKVRTGAPPSQYSKSAMLRRTDFCKKKRPEFTTYRTCELKPLYL